MMAKMPFLQGLGPNLHIVLFACGISLRQERSFR